MPRQARLESGLKSARLLPKIQYRAESRERHDYRAYQGSDRGGVTPNVALPPQHEKMICSFRCDRGDEPPMNPRQHPHLQIASPHIAPYSLAGAYHRCILGKRSDGKGVSERQPQCMP
ncbi:hypothetical protein E2C01_033841 [Portunus trituberculatus]|uniref:Uncharacterized protein n=1 Tax=Portunus trituberculatus TaxID=210409 RepID=A0A5B7F3T1_PORTR|nr:hypothetical protein [Portunus trituberculatus]